MPTVHFMGYVEPRNLGLIVENLEPVRERDANTGYVTTFTIAIWDCVVSVECEIDQFRPEYVSNLYTRSLEMARTLVNLLSLKRGWGLEVHLDTFIPPDGNEETLMNRINKLENLFDSYEESKEDQIFDLVVSDVDLFMAVDDLVGAITTPRVVATNCARVIDAIRYLLAPDQEKKVGWKIVRETLNIEERYLQHISKSSQLTRHGRHQFIHAETAEELIVKTSAVLNRYLHFKTKYDSPLPLDLFPQLIFHETQSSNAT